MPRTSEKSLRNKSKTYTPGRSRATRQRKKQKVAYAESEASMRQGRSLSKSVPSRVMKEEARDLDTEKFRR